MSRYITTKADFTLRRKHKKGSGATIYENDYTTINPMPNALKGEYVIGDSNFVFTSRLGINGQKKHVRGKFLPNPMGENSAWTIDTIIDSGITDETRIRLKPNYNSLRDFACYGSAVKIIQGTVNGVITDFPAEMYLSDDDIEFYGPEPGKAGYSDNELIGVLASGKSLYNEYSIDITTESLQPENIYNPLRYFALCGSSYTYIEGQNTYDFSGFTVTNTASGTCYGGKSIQIDKLASVDLMFSGEQGQKTIKVEIFKDYDTDEMFYMYSGGTAGGHIRPKKKIVEDYFRDCDDFTAVLLDRTNKPIYTSSFEAPEETETGIKYEMKSFTWPTVHGGYNPDLSLGYYTYVQGLMDIAAFYDEYFTDNMWRSLTHEAIKTLDWTYVSNTGDEVEEMLDIDTSRIEPIVKLYGRQFDDLKRYADAIKSINTITYNQKSNTPDYTLTDVLENSGWETKTLKITTDNEIATSSLYAGLTSGYTASDANNEFLRRLKLNSRYLLSIKGTRKGLDTMLAMFGFTPGDYKITEYVSVFSGNSYPNFCESTAQLPSNIKPAFPLAKDISTVNKYKINFNTFDPYGDYCGIPVAEVGYFIENPSDPDKPYDCSYVVPWYSHGKTYDDGLYFQMHGGWGKRRDMDIDLEIAPEVKNITSWEGVVPLYMETQARLKFAKDFDELLQEAYAESKIHDVFYITDISKMQEEYSLNGETIESASHYFVLENEELKQFLGYASDYTGLTKYGWRSIDNSEIQDPGNNSAGTLVLYLESIKDDTTGNNPHVGNGTYDDGMAYISGMSQVFNYSLVNKNFIGIDDNTCKRISGFSFDVTMQEDNRKCWFFTDFYSSGYGKDVANEEKIYFRETDVTDYIGDIQNCNDSKLGVYSGCTAADLEYDILDLLEDADLNEEVQIGVYVNSSSTEEVNVSHIYSGETELYSGKTVNGCYTGSPYGTTGFSNIYYYGRESNLDTFNPETRERGKNGEAAANSVVNLKNITILFKIPEDFSEADRKSYRKYIETEVVPYLTQMIPSTSILKWEFNIDGNVHPYVPGGDEVVTHELVLEPNSTTVELEPGASTSYTAFYVTKVNGTQTAKVNVTASARWTSSNSENVPVSNGRITGINSDTQTAKTGVVTVSYGDAEPKTINVTVKKAGLPSIQIVSETPIPGEQTTISYTVICDDTVTVSCGSLPSKTSKSGYFTVGENDTDADKNYVLTARSTVPAHTAATATITVVQRKKEAPVPPPTPDPELSIAPTTATVTYEGGDVSVTVTSNTGWTLTASNTTAGTLNINEGTGNGSFIVTMKPYTNTNQGRSLTVTAKTVDGQISKTIKITQTKAPTPEDPTISLNVDTDSVPQAGQTVSYGVTVTPEGTPIKVVYGDQEKDTLTGSITIPENTATTEVTHTITAYCVGREDIYDTKTVTQEGTGDPATNFNVRPASLSFVDTGESKSLFIENVPNGYNWKVTDITTDEWLYNISETAGTTDKELQVTAGRNDGAARSGRLKVELFKDGTVKNTKYVELDQAEYVDRTFRVTQISNPFAYTGSSQTFKIINPEGHRWQIKTTSLPSWLTLPVTAGTDTEKAMFTEASDNTGNIGGRDGYIIVIDLDNNNREYSVYATQYGLNGVKINFDNEVKNRLSGLDFIRINGVSVYSVNYAFHMNGCMWYSYTQQVQTIDSLGTTTNCLPKHESYISIDSIEIPSWAESHFKCFEFHSDETFAGEDSFDWTGTTGLSMTEALDELNQVLGQARHVKAIYNSTIILRANELPPEPTDTLLVELRPDEEFDATTCTTVLMIDSNTGWTISTNTSWIVINSRTGSGTDERTIEIKPNIGERRTGFIMVETTNGLQEEIEINQRAPRTLETRLELGMSEMSLYVNETRVNTAKFYATINGEECITNQDVTNFAEWHSGDESIATVSLGEVTGLRSGSTEIWATYNDAKSLDCPVNVQ